MKGKITAGVDFGKLGSIRKKALSPATLVGIGTFLILAGFGAEGHESLWFLGGYCFALGTEKFLN